MATALTAAAKSCLQPSRNSRHHGKFMLSQRTQQLIVSRRKAHQTWLRTRTDVARRARNKLNRQADRAAQLDLQQYIDRQAIEAQTLLRCRDIRGFSRAVKRMAGQQRSKAVPTGMRDVEGNVQHGPVGVLKVLTKHFSDLLGEGAELSENTCNEMEADVFMFEQEHADGDTNQSAGDTPTLAEVEECVKALRNHASPGEDMIDARMLKAGPVVKVWMHRVITAVWKSGKAPAEWKCKDSITVTSLRDTLLPYLYL